MNTDKPKLLLSFEELYRDLLNELGCQGHQGAVVEIRRLRARAGLSDKPKDEDSYKDYVQVEEKPTLPNINAVFETETKELIGTTDARIKRIVPNDDGSITVVIDHWPVTVIQKQPSSSAINPGDTVSFQGLTGSIGENLNGKEYKLIEEEPLRCDVCHTACPDHWHFSSRTIKHLHACDACWETVDKNKSVTVEFKLISDEKNPEAVTNRTKNECKNKNWCEGCNPNNCSGCHTPLNKVGSEPTKDN